MIPRMAERIISAHRPCARWPKPQASATIPAAGRGGMALVVDVEAIRSWLTARLDEDEQEADGFHDYAWCAKSLYDDPCDCKYPDRIRREVEAKRRRLERHSPRIYEDYGHPPHQQAICEACGDHWPCPDVIDDAQSWADRPDFPAELRLP